MNFPMVKIEKISQNISPFGGVSFVHDMFNSYDMRKLIDKESGTRVSICGYTYGTLWETGSTCLCVAAVVLKIYWGLFHIWTHHIA